MDPLTADDFDVLHAEAGEAGSLLARLNGLAFGAASADPIEPFGQGSIPLLDFAARRLRLKPGDHLIDLGCGRGGPGLWLSRRWHVRLTGVDFSRVALADAARRAARMSLSFPPAFRHGELTRTGLPDAYADAVIGIDSILSAENRTDALREIGRLLRPRGRALITVAQTSLPMAARHPRALVGWQQLCQQANLTVHAIVEPPDTVPAWSRLHRLWLRNATHLRRTLGSDLASKLLAQAHLSTEVFADHRELVLVLAKH